MASAATRSLLLTLSVAAASGAAHANQGFVVRDGTLGSAAASLEVASGVDPLGAPADYLITADLGEQRGANLFHSFARFGIGVGETATFTEQGAPDPGAIEHVISRVTGGSLSRIDGTLRSTLPGADVWLINPSGLVFGPRAQLDVPGSFHAATADSVDSDDAGLARFYADLSRPSVLAIADPRAFGFLGSAATPIALEPGASLSVGAGKNLELSGGDITFTDAEIAASGAHVRLTARDGIELLRSSVDVSGPAPGSVAIVGGRLVLEGGPVAGAARSLVLAENAGAGPGGNVSVDARESVRVENGLLSVNTSSSGDAGTLAIASPIVRFERGPGLDPELPLATPVGASAETTALGAGGRIRIDARELTLRNGVALSAVAAGWPIGERTGRGGTVEIAARSVEVSERSTIAAAAWGSIGGGGVIRIDLGRDGSLLVDAQHAPGAGYPDRYAYIINKNTGGDAGLIEIRGGSIRVVNGGSINVACNRPCGDDSGSIRILEAASLVVESGGVIISDTNGEGRGGDITIEANEVSVSHLGQIITGTNGNGDGGDITIDADSVLVRGGSVEVGAQWGSTGDAGSIRIATGSLTVDSLGAIRAVTQGEGRGGDISVRARDTISLSFAGGVPLDLAALVDAGRILRNEPPPPLTGIFSAAAVWGGDAGSIALEAPEITIEDGAIVASTTLLGGGAGGDVTMSGDRIRILGGGLVDASTLPLQILRLVYESGDAGDVTLVARELIEIAGHHVLEPTQRSQVGSRSLWTARPGRERSDAARAGNVRLSAPRIEIAGGSVRADAQRADGGNITLVARDRVRLIDGEISAAVDDGAGGNIAIDPTFVILEDGSRILASAGAGTGGNIRITAQSLFAFPGSVIDASSELGIDGVVEIHAPDADLSGTLTALPASFVNAASLLRERCAARRAGGRSSSFTVRGSSGVAEEPDAPLMANALAYAGDKRAATLAFASPLVPSLFASRASCE